MEPGDKCGGIYVARGELPGRQDGENSRELGKEIGAVEYRVTDKWDDTELIRGYNCGDAESGKVFVYMFFQARKLYQLRMNDQFYFSSISS